MLEVNAEKIEVWLLTGFLGSGKTTMMNYLLNSEYFASKNTALVINEFGKLGVDSHLVKDYEMPVYEINKGSIFCVCTKTEFVRIFQQLQEGRPDSIIIEATGIADTSSIEQLLNEPVLGNTFEVRANICLVDAMSYIQTAAFLKTAASQVQQADAVIVNKIDMVIDDILAETVKFVRELNPRAKLIAAEFGEVSMETLAEIKHEPISGKLSECPPLQISSAYIMTEAIIDKDMFLHTIEQMKDNILRLKGDVCFIAEKCFMEIAGKQHMVKGYLGTFGASTAFSVIGWKVTQEELKYAFEKCIL